MQRILADLPEDDIAWLDGRATELATSRAALLREAVAAYRNAAQGNELSRYFGMWRDRDTGSGE